ncbi:class I SAM-dependent methyltransferase [Roseomonas sp. GC11]|uniref:methyltransferase domain-containing protein n=1 Tax=Roseomonas sp. GC11 TaxID=2950546 RepID=UPI00210CC48C|nr:methyltransferase domain-containing protein [Roseomonas sp. GC11]MCQ4162226.1 class I SAM-dependent methyltransferase [Roseomonas sp. GC11]
MSLELLARRILTLTGAGPCLLLGDDGAPLVAPLLALGVDARCHAASAALAEAGHARMPGRFTSGPLAALRTWPAGLGTLVLLGAPAEMAGAGAGRALRALRRLVRGALLLHAPGEAPPDGWEATALAAGFRHHPRQVQTGLLREAGLSGGALLLLEPLPERLPRGPATPHPSPARQDMLRGSSPAQVARRVRYDWARRWIKAGDHVADAGGGPGDGAWFLARMSEAARLTAILPGAAMAAYARAAFAHPRIVVVEEDPVAALESLPENSVDCLLCFEALERGAEPDRLLAACHRVLTPAGRLLLALPAAPPPPAPSGTRSRSSRAAPPGWAALRERLAARFLLDVTAAQTGWDHPGGARLRPFPPEAEPPAAQWLLASAIKPYALGPQPAYPPRLVIEGEPVRINPTDFAGMLDNPWLHRGLLDGGMRPADPALLRRTCLALIEHGPEKARAAALTVLGYRLLEDGTVEQAALAAHLRQIGQWVAAWEGRARQPQVARWLVSLAFLAALLAQKTGALALAAQWFNRCIATDPAPFGPMLFTKTVEACHRLGWIHYGQGEPEAARRAWQEGLDQARRALGLRRDAGRHPLAPRLNFVFDEYAAICDMACRCAIALNHLDNPAIGLERAPSFARPRERQMELLARIARLSGELSAAQAALRSQEKALEKTRAKKNPARRRQKDGAGSAAGTGKDGR